MAFCFQRHKRSAAITASAKACGEFSRTLQEKHQRSDNIWRPLAYRCSDWRRQFGPALDQTIFGLERPDPLVMSGAAASLALVAIVAALVPARGAELVDPLLVLRHE